MFFFSYFFFSFLFVIEVFSIAKSILVIKSFVTTILYILGLILTAAFLTLFERQVLGSIQHRKGPNIVGFLGLIQPISDAVKLLIKEPVMPKKADNILFLLSSLLIIILSLLL
jgi:NADH-quinone oxidoreductase subunit H